MEIGKRISGPNRVLAPGKQATTLGNIETGTKQQTFSGKNYSNRKNVDQPLVITVANLRYW